ncbi:unnamed protein product, partial [Oppiella nova]
FVEFDDGDNGRIAVDDIRLLPQEYPQMKINADPLKNLERKRRMSSCGKDSRHSKGSFDNFGDEKKSSAEDIVSHTILSKSSSNEELNKNDLNSKNKINRNTHESNGNNLSQKLEIKKKKKKHNKEDRHHRHHHNHKHHHCRHHKKCKKHKKSREGNSIGSSGVRSIAKRSTDSNVNDNCEQNGTKSTKLMTWKTSTKDMKSVQKRDSDAQRVLDTNNVDKNEDNNRTEKTHMRTIVKKTAKQRALDRLRTNLSEKMCTIMSPIRRNLTTKTNTTTTTTAPVPKKRERIPSAEKSKIAAFLPVRQLWHWSGKWIRRTGAKGSRTRKIFYKEIERGRERIRVDDCAVFLSTGRPHLPYIGRIDSMWQTGSGTMIVKVRWFYHPEETKGQPTPLQDKRGALFESSHFDVNDVQTISHKCLVISWTEYQERRTHNPLLSSADDPPNVYYMAGKYDALAGRVEMDPCVPVKDKSKDDKTEKIENE